MPSDPDIQPPQNIREWINRKAPAHIADLLDARDGGYRLVEALSTAYPPNVIGTVTGNVVWEQIGRFYLVDRPHVALPVFLALYAQMLKGQSLGHRIPKGMALCWLSDCFRNLKCNLHAKRYLMLTLCEDAISGNGSVSPKTQAYIFAWYGRWGSLTWN